MGPIETALLIVAALWYAGTVVGFVRSVLFGFAGGVLRIEGRVWKGVALLLAPVWPLWFVGLYIYARFIVEEP